jgi:hypothetical protein
METTDPTAGQVEAPRSVESAESSAASYGLLYITRAYNNREISFEEWMKQSREWAESIIRQYGNNEGKAD